MSQGRGGATSRARRHASCTVEVMISRLYWRVSTLALAFALAGCHKTPDSTLQVKTHGAVVANAARYGTYSHETAPSPPVGYARGSLTPEVLEAVRRQVDVEMKNKGYVLVPSGDLVVRIATGVRTAPDAPTGAAAAAGAPVEEDWVGALVIDLFERNGAGHLFHGYAKDELRAERISDEQIRAAVTKILEPLPPRDAGR